MSEKKKHGFHVPDMDELRERWYVEDFGAFASDARKKCNLTFRAAAEEIGITAAYLSDIEKGKEKPPTRKVLDAMIKAYKLSDKARNEFNRLATKARGTVSLEFVNLINGYPAARHIVMLISVYRDYLEDKSIHGAVSEEEVNNELWKLAREVGDYVQTHSEQEGDNDTDDED